MPDRPIQEIEAIFHRTLDVPPARRRGWLESFAAGDHALIATVWKLLEVDARLEPSSTPPLRPTPLALPDRFEALGRLGAGGMGVVIEAYDRMRSARVAVKSPKRLDAEAVYRLKQEFRTAASISHPNLVQLYDLIVYNDKCIYTMELVEGIDVVRWCRPNGTLDIRRTGAALVQLAHALRHLHARNLVHRDVKRSNVLVEDTGRLVLLDFGLTRWIDWPRGRRDGYGSAHALAPEQVAGTNQASPAVDWYGLGALIFEILTGQPPFSGPVRKVLIEKLHFDAPDPALHAPGAPSELLALCRGLLQRDPARRPTGEEVLRRLRVSRYLPPIRPAIMVGRQAALAAVVDDASRRDPPATALFVQGPAGIGKTLLLYHAVDRLRAHESVVLVGRCRPRETVPVNALDEVMDDLTSFLLDLPHAQRARFVSLVSDDVITLFPVFERVRPGTRSPSSEAADPADLRAQAVRDWLRLFGALCEAFTLILVIDDIQFGDRDSTRLLVELLASRTAPNLICAHRNDDNVVSSVEALRADLSGVGVLVRTIELPPLEEQDSRTLATSLLPPTVPDAVLDTVIEASRGHPLHLTELARLAVHRGDDSTRLDEMLLTRWRRLPEPARRLLATVAAANRPLPLDVASAAARIDEAPETVATLLERDAWLVIAWYEQVPMLDVRHAQLREAILRALDEPALRQTHLHLAETLAQTHDADPQQLTLHFQEGGRHEEACRSCLEAARRALAGLEFEQAALLYRHALDLLPESDNRRVDTTIQLGWAHLHGGHGVRAADAFLNAAAHVRGEEATDLRRLAADGLMRSGHIGRGLELFRGVAKSLGITLAPTRLRALLRVAWLRLRVKLRGLRWKRAEAGLDEIRRLDTLFTVGTALGMTDHLYGAAMHAAHLLDALRVGDTRIALRATLTEVGFLAALADRRSLASAKALSERVGPTVRDTRAPLLLGWSHLSDGMIEFFSTRFAKAADRFAAADQEFKQAGTSVVWEKITARFFGTYSTILTGALREVREPLEGWIQDARRRNDVYAQNLFRSVPAVWLALADDDPERASELNDGSLAGWADEQGFYLPHFWRNTGRLLIHLYAGRAEDALRLAKTTEALMRRSQLHRARTSVAEILLWKGNAAAAAGEVRQAEKSARRLLAFERPHHSGAAYHALAGARLLQGDLEAGEDYLRRAVEAFETSECRIFLATSRVMLGRLVGGGEGLELEELGRMWFDAQKIAAPERLMRVLFPVATLPGAS